MKVRNKNYKKEDIRFKEIFFKLNKEHFGQKHNKKNNDTFFSCIPFFMYALNNETLICAWYSFPLKIVLLNIIYKSFDS